MVYTKPLETGKSQALLVKSLTCLLIRVRSAPSGIGHEEACNLSMGALTANEYYLLLAGSTLVTGVPRTSSP